jgi:predicted nucleotidyltransferase
MIEWKEIENFCNRIIQRFHPDKIILYGSYGYGNPGQDSDVDILVVLPFEVRCAQKAAEILIQTDPHFPVDLLARTPQQVEERVALGDFFIKEIVEKGKVIYEAPNSRMG